MGINFSNDKPIFMQFADIIKQDIMSGKFKANQKLPPVREFAFDYSINPNTVQKALQILEADGLIETDRTNGKFVVDNLKKIQMQKIKLINDEIDMLFEKARSLGFDLKEIKEIIYKRGE